MNHGQFVGRLPELAQLDGVLEKALTGRGRVVFVVGEAGIGKTALVREFARRAQERYPTLLVAIGDCNAQSGVGEAYLPFREILGLLTGDLEQKRAQGVITDENARRLQQALVKSGMILLDVGYQLVDTLVPGGNLITTLSRSASKHSGLDAKLEKLAATRSSKIELPADTIERDSMFEQCTRFLCTLAASHPLILVIDDLQWADSSSLSLLFHLGRRIDRAPLLVVGCYRPDEVALPRDSQRHPLEKVMAEFQRYYGDITIPMDWQDPSAAAGLVDAYLDAVPNRFSPTFRAELLRHTGANPLFMIELLESLTNRGNIEADAAGCWRETPSLDWSILPARVEGVLDERIGRLDQDLRDTLNVASVEGERFTAEIVARLRGVDERGLVLRLGEELGKKQHLIGSGTIERIENRRVSRYSFLHKLLQQHLYDGLDDVQRVYLHEDIGNVLEEMYRSRLEDVAVELAWHFDAAGLPEKAATYHRQAAQRATRRFAHTEAAQHLTRALELTAETDLTQRYDILLERATVYDWMGQHVAQARDLETLAEMASGSGDPTRLAGIELRQANLARVTGDYDQALVLVERAVQRASKSSLLEAQAYNLYGRILIHRGAYVEAAEVLELALLASEDNNRPDLCAQIEFDLGLTDYHEDRLAAAQAHFDQARTLFDQVSNRRGVIQCLRMTATVHHLAGRLTAALADMQQALELSRISGWRHSEAFVLGNLGGLQFDLGDFAAAHASYTQALALCRDLGDREGEAVALDTLGLIALYRQDINTARDLLTRAQAIQEQIGDRRGQAYTLTHVGYAQAAAGDLTAATTAFQQALAIRDKLQPHSGPAVDAIAGLAQVALAAGRHDEAHRGVIAALTWMETHDPNQVEYPVQVCLICAQIAQSLGGRFADTPALARRALDLGTALLQQRAAQIDDVTMRQRYLDNVPFNLEVARRNNSQSS